MSGSKLLLTKKSQRYVFAYMIAWREKPSSYGRSLKCLQHLSSCKRIHLWWDRYWRHSRITIAKVRESICVVESQTLGRNGLLREKPSPLFLGTLNVDVLTARPWVFSSIGISRWFSVVSCGVHMNACDPGGSGIVWWISSKFGKTLIFTSKRFIALV